MADIAQLAIQIDSRQAKTAGRDLQQFQRTARTTERSAGQLTAANDNLANSFRTTASSVAVMHGPLGGVASRFSAMGTLMTRTGAAAGTLAVGLAGATFAAQRGVRAFANFERQLLTTEQVILSTGGAAGRTVEDIEELSRGIGMATLASTSEVREAANQLLTFRSISGAVFDETLTLAQDLAAVGFGSVSSAARQLGKSLEDPITGVSALREAGISFSATQREVIRNLVETGRMAEAQRRVLAQVEDQVGGAGAAAGKGLAGAFDGLTEQSARWFELIGERISDVTGMEAALRGMAGGVGAVNDSMEMAGTGRGREADLRGRRAQLQQAIANNQPTIDSLRDAGASERFINDTIIGLRQWREELAQIDGQLRAVAMANQMVAAMEERRAETTRRLAQEDEARKRIEDVEAEIQKRIELIGASEQELAVKEALAKAQTTDPEVVQRIEEQIAREYELIAAHEDDIAAEERKAQAKRQGREAVTAITSELETELAVLQESDPAKQRMIELSEDLTRASEAEREAIRAKVQAIEEERGAQAGADMERELENRLALVGATDAQRAAHSAMQRAADAGASRGQIKRVGELAAAQVEAANAAQRHKRRQEELRREHEQGRKSVRDLIQSLEQQVAVERESDPVKKELIGLSERMADATARERDQIEALVKAKHAEADANKAITASQPDRSGTIPGVNDGPHGGSAGGAQRLSFNFNTGAQRELDALARERAILQTGMQFKQLTPEQERQTERRLAEIDLETAKLNERMGETSDAFSTLSGSINQMAAAGTDFSQIATWVRQRMAGMMGTSMNIGMGGGPSLLSFADGGMISGRGGPRDDANVIRVSNGESVINEPATTANRGALATINADEGRTTFDLLPKLANDEAGIGPSPMSQGRMQEQQVTASTTNNSTSTDKSVNVGPFNYYGGAGEQAGRRGSDRQQGRDIARMIAQYR